MGQLDQLDLRGHKDKLAQLAQLVPLEQQVLLAQ
jgi:hypothetical protein